MAVQILNEMPDIAVHRGEPADDFSRALNQLNMPRVNRPLLRGRAGFIVVVVGMHAVAALALLQMTRSRSQPSEAPPIMASLVESPADAEPPPPAYTPPPMEVTYSLPTPQEISLDTEPVSETAGTVITSTGPVTTAAPPMVDSVEYIHAVPPVYPKESQRKREHGTVLLRVLVDAAGRPAQIQIERSSGFSRLDDAARAAVEKFLFQPYEVNGVARSAQVLIPIGFDRHAY